MLHGQHGVGQHQHVEPARQAERQHWDNFGVHKRLAAGKPDLADAQVLRVDLIQVDAHFTGGDVGQAVVYGARFDITVHAGEVAEGSGIEPHRIQAAKGNRGALGAVGGDGGILELITGQRWLAADIVGQIGAPFVAPDDIRFCPIKPNQMPVFRGPAGPMNAGAAVRS